MLASFTAARTPQSQESWCQVPPLARFQPLRTQFEKPGVCKVNSGYERENVNMKKHSGKLRVQ
jgi:hypothetical protein